MAPESEPERFNFRLVLLGSLKTGKTSIINRFLFHKYMDRYRPTVEDLFTRDFDFGTVVLRVDFLDTSGSMQFPAMRRLSIRTASAFLIVYSVDDLVSVQVAKQCLEEIREIRTDHGEIPIVLAGNKCDVPEEQRVVSRNEIADFVFCGSYKLRAKVIEVSCKENHNITDLFRSYLTLARIPIPSVTSDGPVLNRRSSARCTSGRWNMLNRSSWNKADRLKLDNREAKKRASSTDNLDTTCGPDTSGSATSGSNKSSSTCNSKNKKQKKKIIKNKRNETEENGDEEPLIKMILNATSALTRFGRYLTGKTKTIASNDSSNNKTKTSSNNDNAACGLPRRLPTGISHLCSSNSSGNNRNNTDNSEGDDNDDKGLKTSATTHQQQQPVISQQLENNDDRTTINSCNSRYDDHDHDNNNNGDCKQDKLGKMNSKHEFKVSNRSHFVRDYNRSSSSASNKMAAHNQTRQDNLQRVAVPINGSVDASANDSGSVATNCCDTGNNNNNPSLDDNNNNNNSSSSQEANNNYRQQHKPNHVVATKSQPLIDHLSAMELHAKPRSRSLMRRSTRKSKVRDQNDLAQCLPS